MHNIEIPHKNKLLSLLHVNVCSPKKNVDDLQHLLNCLKKIDIRGHSKRMFVEEGGGGHLKANKNKQVERGSLHVCMFAF